MFIIDLGSVHIYQNQKFLQDVMIYYEDLFVVNEPELPRPRLKANVSFKKMVSNLVFSVPFFLFLYPKRSVQLRVRERLTKSGISVIFCWEYYGVVLVSFGFN